MRELPEEFSVVSDIEFEVLRHLPEFELTDADTLRRQVGEQYFFVWRQSDFERCEAIAAGVDAEILAGEQSRADSEAHAAAALQAEVTPPKVDTEPEPEPQTNIQPHWRFRSDRFRGFGDN